VARVALLVDYEDAWASNLQRHAQGWDYWALQMAFYTVLRGLGVDVAVQHPDRDLGAHAVVVAPSLHLMDAARAARLERFVGEGGVLLLGPRSGAKTPSNLAHEVAPGPLRALSGVRCDRVDALRPGLAGTIALGTENHAYATWADLLTPEDAEALAHYREPAFEGAAALTRRIHGRGACLVLGAWAGPELMTAVLTPLLRDAGIAPRPLPDGVRVSRTGRPTLLNFSPEPAVVDGVSVPSHGVRFLDDEPTT
jgi:beta-galactosidase